jgi:polyisoprenoid-binding protein YceI
VNTTTTSRTYAIDASHTTVEFVVRHLMITKVRGRFTAVSGTIAVPDDATVPTSVDVEVDAKTIDTREEQRDNHLRSEDFLHTDQHAKLTFKSTSIEGDGDDFKVHGDLTIRGVTQKVTLDATFEGRVKDPWGGERIGYSASTKINRKDFGLTWNVLLEGGGLTVGEDIRIELNVEAVAQP